MVQALDGTTDSYVDAADAKVLYEVDEARLVGLLAAPAVPSQLGEQPDLDTLLTEPRYGDAPSGDPDVPEGQRNRWLRHSVTRRVLDDPVVYLDELSDAQRGYVTTPSGRRVVREAAAAAGLQLEERAEGLLGVDAEAVATDTRFPAEHSHSKHAALLLLDVFEGDCPVPMSRLVAHVAALLQRFGSWARAYQSDGGPPGWQPRRSTCCAPSGWPPATATP